MAARRLCSPPWVAQLPAGSARPPWPSPRCRLLLGHHASCVQLPLPSFLPQLSLLFLVALSRESDLQSSQPLPRLPLAQEARGLRGCEASRWAGPWPGVGTQSRTRHAGAWLPEGQHNGQSPSLTFPAGPATSQACERPRPTTGLHSTLHSTRGHPELRVLGSWPAQGRREAQRPLQLLVIPSHLAC